MERSDWLNFKKTGQINLEWLYKYYLDNKSSNKEELTPISFNDCIQMFLGRGGQINKFIEYWDNEHEITTIIDTENHNTVINYV